MLHLFKHKFSEFQKILRQTSPNGEKRDFLLFSITQKPAKTKGLYGIYAANQNKFEPIFSLFFSTSQHRGRAVKTWSVWILRS